MGDYLFRPDDSPPHKCDLPMDERKLRTPPRRDGTPSNTFTTIKDTPALGSVWRCECGKIWEVQMHSPSLYREERRTWLSARWRTRRKYAIRNNK